MHLLVVCPPGVGRQALHPSSPPATSALAATSSEEEGLHARPLPHIFGEYWSALTLRTTEEEGLAHSPPPRMMTVCTSEAFERPHYLPTFTVTLSTVS